MDNVTHTLMGLLLGHATAAPKRLRPALVWTAVFASNLPDLDVVLQPILGGGKIAYLLHHRGYTHTVLVALPLGLVSAALGAAVGRAWSAAEEEGTSRPRAAALLLGVGLLGALLHIAADAMNNYGVHPFWPWDNRWLYGDSIFIVEPLLILAMTPFAILNATTPWRRRAWTGVATLTLLALWIPGITPWPASLAATAMGAAVFAAQRRARERAWPALVALSMVGAMFFGLARRTRALVLAEARARLGPEEPVIDVVTTPAPADPFCWWALLGTRTGDGVVVARSLAVSHLPGLVDPARCFYRLGAPATAPTRPVTGAGLVSSERTHWFGEFRGRLRDLSDLVSEQCEARAAMRFIRVPYWSRAPEGTTVLGDLRYDFEPELGFAEIEGDAAQARRCPRFVPPWEPPFAPLAAEVMAAPGR